jgi:hypothetical protein
MLGGYEADMSVTDNTLCDFLHNFGCFLNIIDYRVHVESS